MIFNPHIWSPKIGDLVAIPQLGALAPGIRQKSFYGIVIIHSPMTESCAIFFEGGIKWFDNVILMPLWDVEGTWLQTGKSGT
jgi:hypothetical protein